MEKKEQHSIPQETINWLLESQTPTIRYSTYKNILNLPDSDDRVRDTQAQIIDSDYVKAILADQNPEGFWYTQRHYYGPKYRSTHWSMLLLSELAVPAGVRPLQKGAQFMIGRMEDEKNVYYPIASYQNKDQSGFCCYWGNWLRYQLYCGNIEHPTVQQVIDIICDDVHRQSRCEQNNHLPCAWGMIRSLYGLALIPEPARTEKVNEAINKSISFILDSYALNQANYPHPGKIHPIWFKLSFPLYYQTDILFTLRVLGEVKALNQSGAQDALTWLEDKRKKDGTWRGGSPFRSRSHPFLSGPDSVNRWITLQALGVLSAANEQCRE